MNPTPLFTQFRSYCTQIESDTSKLRSVLQSKCLEIPPTTDYDYVDSLFEQVHNLERKFRVVDEKLCGTVDDRLSRISVDEILHKCIRVFEGNELLVNNAFEEFQRFGIPVNITKPSNAFENIEDDYLNEDNIEVEDIELPVDSRNSDNNGEYAPSNIYYSTENQCEAQIQDEYTGNECSTMGIIQKSNNNNISASNDNGYTSPLHTGFRSINDNPKTPVLADWSLSDATRIILGEVSPQNTDDNDSNIKNNNYIKFPYETSTNAAESVAANTNIINTKKSHQTFKMIPPPNMATRNQPPTTPSSPDNNLNLSYSTAAILQPSSYSLPHQSDNSSVEDGYMTKNINVSFLEEEIIPNYQSTAKKLPRDGVGVVVNNQSPSTPLTPEADTSSPLRTCSLASFHARLPPPLPSVSTPNNKMMKSLQYKSSVTPDESPSELDDLVDYLTTNTSLASPKVNLRGSGSGSGVPLRPSSNTSVHNNNEQQGLLSSSSSQYYYDNQTTTNNNNNTLTSNSLPPPHYSTILNTIIPQSQSSILSSPQSDDDGGMSPLSTFTFSPPKLAKLLNPPRQRTGVAGSSRNSAMTGGWIPLLEEEEWDSLPTFLKLQIPVIVLNIGIESLNNFIDTSQEAEIVASSSSGSTSSHRRLETFTQEEIQQMIGDMIGDVSVKIVILALVHLKRLDIGTENSIKVYKVRRFY